MTRVRPGCRAYRVRVDGHARSKTRVALVFLHGLSAGPGEFGDAPLKMGQRLAANVYVARLPGHGLMEEDALRGSTVPQWLTCAERALDVGLRLGEKVVLVGSSLGASLAMITAARHPDQVAAVIAWSLGVRPADPAALARLCCADQPIGRLVTNDPHVARFWSPAVHPDAYRALDGLFTEWMCPDTARGVLAPFLLAYWYRDEMQMDPVASVPAMLELFEHLSTPAEQRRAIAYAEGAHSIGSPWRSKAAAQVWEDSLKFLRDLELW